MTLSFGARKFKRNLLKKKPSVVTSMMIGHSIYDPANDLFLHYDDKGEWRWIADPYTVMFASERHDLTNNTILTFASEKHDLTNNTVAKDAKKYCIEDEIRVFLKHPRIIELEFKGCQLVPSNMYVHEVNSNQVDTFMECDFLNACDLLDLLLE